MLKEQKPIDVFIDFEGIGRLENIRGWFAKIDVIAGRLPLALGRQGYTIASVNVFASYKRPNEIVPPDFQRAVRKAMNAHGWKMSWSSMIADEVLVGDVRKSLVAGTLSDAVMIITSDHDFIALIRELTNAGRFVIVSGTAMNKRLQAHANVSIPLKEFLGITAPDPISTSSKDVIFNPIPI